MKRILVLVALVLAVLAGVVVWRGSRLESRQVSAEPASAAPVDADAAARRLARAVRFRTISHFDSAKLDREAFLAFQAFLRDTFPAVHARLERERVAGLSLLYRWPGSDPDLQPVVLCAHQDVVPVPEGSAERWTHPPFGGEIADGFVWGRGAMDDKANLMAILEAVERLVSGGFAPKRTVILAFGHDEEVGGTGAQAMADRLAERDIEPAFVLDEGMAVIEGVVPGLDAPAALVGVAEKGYLSVRLVVSQPGGHSSTPPRHTAVGILASAIDRLERAPLPAHFAGVSRGLFDYLGPELPFAQRLVFANLWLFEGVLMRRLAANPGTNATIRTTTAATMFEGSPKDNVLPTRAEAVVNFRILPGDTVQSVLEHVRKAVDDERVEVAAIGTPREPSPVSPLDSPDFARLQRTVAQIFPEALFAPALVLGGTDARHYGEVTRDVYRFSPYRFGPGDLSRVHGIDERVAVEGHATAARFYEQLIRNAQP